jgi:hypothetical protein
MGERKSLLARIVTWTIIGLLAVVAFKLLTRLLAFVVGLLGVAFGVAMFLLFTVGPLILLGWLAMKVWDAFARHESGI